METRLHMSMHRLLMGWICVQILAIPGGEAHATACLVQSKTLMNDGNGLEPMRMESGTVPICPDNSVHGLHRPFHVPG